MLRLARRFATEILPGTLKLSFVCPHQVIAKEKLVHQVNLSTSDGDMGILGGHVPTILQIRAGVVEVVHDAAATSKDQYFGMRSGSANGP